MFTILCRRGLRVLLRDCDFLVPRNVKSFSSDVCNNGSEKPFAVSYLINSCGLSSKDAISASKKLCFESPKKPDAVLKLLREYGFTDAHIPRIVIKWPFVLVASPVKTLLPKLEFLLSFGVPLPVLRQTLFIYPDVLKRSLGNSLIPLYNYFRSLLQSDEMVVQLFKRAPMAFGWCSEEKLSSNISMLRERGVPQSSIVTFVMSKPTLLMRDKEKLEGYVDRAVEMGFEISRGGFVEAVKVFAEMTESTLKHKMEVYTKCGWSESDIKAAFLRYPHCLKYSEKKIISTMDFLVNELGLKPVVIAEKPEILGYSLEERIKPRCLVARILDEKGLKKMANVSTLLPWPEDEFLKRYIVKYQKDVPELLDIYFQSTALLDRRHSLLHDASGGPVLAEQVSWEMELRVGDRFRSRNCYLNEVDAETQSKSIGLFSD